MINNMFGWFTLLFFFCDKPEIESKSNGIKKKYRVIEFMKL
jgi:hypothetical protein